VRKLFVIGALATVVGCMSTTEESQFGATVISEGLQGGFTPNETLEMYQTSKAVLRRGRIEQTGDFYNYSTERYDIEINSVEVPWTTENALDAQRANWVAGCSADRMSDRTTCRMNVLPNGPIGNDGGLFQTVDRQGNIQSSCVFGHDFPGRSAQIRVDNNRAITTNTEGCIYGAAARRLQQQLLSGSSLQTRRVEWPYNSSRDKEILIAGAYRAAREVYQFSSKADLASLFNQSE
jgi:hypothetical protein